MKVALNTYDRPSFAIANDGLIEVLLGRDTATETFLHKSVLFCPFCGTKVPYDPRMH
jgi:hypothetical protein